MELAISLILWSFMGISLLFALYIVLDDPPRESAIEQIESRSQPVKTRSPAQNENVIAGRMDQFVKAATYRQTLLPAPKNGRYSWGDTRRGLEHIQVAMEQDNFIPDIIVGLGRSGGVVGGILACLMGSLPIDLLDLHYTRKDKAYRVEFRTESFKLPEDAKKVLVIEGATTAGTTLTTASKLLADQYPGIEFRYAVLIQSEASQFTCNYYAFSERKKILSLPWHGTRSKKYLFLVRPAEETNHQSADDSPR